MVRVYFPCPVPGVARGLDCRKSSCAKKREAHHQRFFVRFKQDAHIHAAASSPGSWGYDTTYIPRSAGAHRDETSRDLENTFDWTVLHALLANLTLQHSAQLLGEFA